MGAVAELEIESDVDIPTDSAMEVRNLSAVGEQYLDVRPRTADGPFLADGATVPVSATSVPVNVPDVLAHAQGLMSHLDVADIRTISDETAAIFGGGEDDVDLRSLAIEMETAFAMVRRLVGPIRISWAITPLWHLAKAAAPLGLAVIMIQIYYSMDQVLLGLLTNRAEVGRYAAAAKVPAVFIDFVVVWMSA